MPPTSSSLSTLSEIASLVLSLVLAQLLLSFDLLVFVHVVPSFPVSCHLSFMVHFKSSLWQRVLAVHQNLFFPSS